VRPVVSTARLQLHGGFTFADAAAVVPYLAHMGVSHLYLSPITEARPGSTHGYDVVDPNRISHALGGAEGFAALVERVHRHHLGVILDVVPNHQAASEDNPAWWAMLRDGPASDRAAWFDVDWRGNALAPPGTVALPVLGRPLDDELASTTLVVDRGGEPVLRYRDRRFPVAPGTGHGDVREVLARQCYRLCWWRDGPRGRSYRRFFDVDDLVGVRVEDPAVFDATHQLVRRLVAAGMVDGLRVDHVDGLARPAEYLRRLRALAGPETYVVVEKVLAPGEDLASWPVEGTTGYDALAALDALFVDPDGFATLDRAWRAAGGAPFATIEQEARVEVLDQLFPAELDRLGTDVAAWIGSDDITARSLVRTATLALDRYRTYATGGRDPDGAPCVIRWQQLCGAVMAKGHEDTAYYRHARLVALNEVGGDPEGPERGDAVARFHHTNQARRDRSPHSMVATTTHDTKRSEDARGRILAITEASGAWQAALDAGRAGSGDDMDPAIIGLVGQTVLAITDDPGHDVEARLVGAIRKSLREAKQRTSWLDPDAVYEDRVLTFARRLLGTWTSRERPPVVDRVARAAAVHALTRTLLKHVMPGVPDLYQGTERLDTSLVDPDNRRPVDWPLRAATLAAWETDLPERASWTPAEADGAKHWVTWRALRLRAEHPDLFLTGDYLPLAARGALADHVVGCARVAPEPVAGGTPIAIALGARLATGIGADGAWPTGDVWGDTVVDLPFVVVAVDRLRPRAASSTARSLRLADLFTDLPVALLTGTTLAGSSV